MNYSVSLLILFLLPLTVFAQLDASISGYINDAETGTTLASANLRLAGTQRGTTTNVSGYFSLTNLKAGSYTLVISYIGYKAFRKKLKLKKGQNLRLKIKLVPKGFLLKEVVVQPEKERDKHAIGAANIEAEFIKEVPTVIQADVFRSLQLMPGVKAASDFSSGLYVRGGGPDQTLILLDGATIYNPTHFFGFFSTFNPNAVRNVRLYKGGYPAKFGGRLGSVLTIFNRSGNINEFQASATFGMLASRASVEGPLKSGSWMLAVRRSTLEPILAFLRESTDSVPNSFYFVDVNSKINLNINANNKLALSFYWGIDDLKFPFSDNADLFLNYGNQIFSGKWTHIFSEKVFSTFTLTGSRYFNYPSFNIASTHFNRTNNIYDFSFKSHFEYSPNTIHKISTGFSLGSLTVKVNDVFDGQEIFNFYIPAKYGSFYLQDEWRFSDYWELTTGVRLNGFSQGRYLTVEPRLSLEYHPSDHLRFQAAYGRYSQFLTLISNEAFTGFDLWLTAVEGVPPAYGDQYVFGIKAIPSDNFRLDLELYYRTMKDLFEPDPLLPNRAGLPYHEIFRFGEGYAYGAEFLFDYQIGKLKGFIGYTYSITRRKFPQFNEPLAKKGNARFYPPTYNRKHSVETVLTYNIGRNWSISAIFNWASGQPFTKPLGRTTMFELPISATDQHQIIVGNVNASRLPAYHRLDLGLIHKGSFFGLGEAKWKLEVINVYSRRNVWFYDFNLAKNPTKRQAVHLLPLLPSISYSLNF